MIEFIKKFLSNTGLLWFEEYSYWIEYCAELDKYVPRYKTYNFCYTGGDSITKVDLTERACHNLVICSSKEEEALEILKNFRIQRINQNRKPIKTKIKIEVNLEDLQ